MGQGALYLLGTRLRKETNAERLWVPLWDLWPGAAPCFRGKNVFNPVDLLLKLKIPLPWRSCLDVRFSRIFLVQCTV